jgi:hypothetical protein
VLRATQAEVAAAAALPVPQLSREACAAATQLVAEQRVTEPLVTPSGASRSTESAVLGPFALEPFALDPDAPPSSRPAALPLVTHVPPPAMPELRGPLQLDLSRIVLPHRVANVPPPPAFVFQPFASSRRAAVARVIAAASPPLAPLGYRVVDRRNADRRVLRGWRVDVAPCLRVSGDRRKELVAASETVVPAAVLPEVLVPEAVLSEVLVTAPEVVFVPEAVAAAEAVVAPEKQPEAVLELVPVAAAPPAPEPLAPSSPAPLLLPELSPASGPRHTLPGSESNGKKQRRRAVRVASGASLMTAALSGKADLSQTLAALEADLTERRIEQPASARKRRGRRSASANGARPRRAANAV